MKVAGTKWWVLSRCDKTSPRRAGGSAVVKDAPSPPPAVARIQVPVYGFYGIDDARVNATIPKSTALMKKAGKTYEPVTYDGAGHGFLRAGEDPEGKPGNKKARDAAWVRIKEILKKI